MLIKGTLLFNVHTFKSFKRPSTNIAIQFIKHLMHGPLETQAASFLMSHISA